MSDVTISPAGDRLAFVKVVNGKSRLVALELPNKTLDVFDVGDTKVRGLHWAGQDHLLLNVSTTSIYASYGDEKHEFSNVEVIDLRTHTVHPLLFKAVNNTDHSIISRGAKGNVVQPFVVAGLGTREIDGHSYGFYELQDEDFNPQFYRVDLDSGELKRLYTPPEDLQVNLVLNDKAEIVAHTSFDSRTGTWFLYGRDEKNRIANGKAKFGLDALDGLGRTTSSVIIGSRENADAGPLREVDVDTGKVTPIDETAPGDFGFLRDPTTHTAIGYVVEGDSPKTVLYDPNLAAQFAKVQRAFKGESVSLVSSSADYKRLVVHTSAGSDSGSYYLFDVPTHSVSEIGLEYPAVGPTQTGLVKMFHYKAQDGTPIDAVLTLPPGRDPKNLPVVVMPHGGPEARDSLHFDWWAQAFAGRGYAVLQPNFRGSSGYDVAFRDAGYGQWGRKMQTDVSDGLVALAAEGVVDPKRACIVGWSYGGYASLAGVTIQKGFYRCSVAGGAVANLETMLDFEDPSGTSVNAGIRRWKTFMGAKTGSDPALHAISPALHASEADAPILIIHGDDDTVVPINQAREMKASLDAAHKPAELLILKDEDHWMTRPEGRTEVMKASVAFVEKYNPADPRGLVEVSPVGSPAH